MNLIYKLPENSHGKLFLIANHGLQNRNFNCRSYYNAC